MFFCYAVFIIYSKWRTEAPINYVILGVKVVAQTCFFGGLCSHAYIATVGLAGIMMAAGSSCVGAAITSATGKSKRLKDTI